MRQTVKLPKLGDTANEVLVLEWSVAVGDAVAAGGVLMRVETDKVEADVPSPVAGTVAELSVGVEDEVPVGAAICVIES
ncbi:MAG: hypothetical protein F4236_01805 [Acidimicrobiia bacterium]|nr:hypothetical protein [Acidimicrobiia bacterium]MYE66939.1 hypothetical protein [Acidimicrobiia bacterium]MYJ13041.1 hypothetical protein [Acidimicrobiia bacterium]